MELSSASRYSQVLDLRTKAVTNVAFPIGFSFLLIYAVLLLLPTNVRPARPGLDASWEYALNLYAHGPEQFGRDIVFTYGPLGYLTVPEPIGSNATIAAIAHWAVCLLLVVLLIQLWRSGHAHAAVLLTVALILSNRLYFAFWDYLICVTVAILMVLLLKRPGNPYYLALLSLTIGPLFLIKFSSYFFVMALLALYSVRKTPHCEWPLLAAAFASGPVAYLFYNLSLSGLAGYIQGSLSLTAGYSSAMSLPAESAPEFRAAALCLFVAVCAALAIWKRFVTSIGAAMVFFSIWISVKHGFVRADNQHTGVFFCFIIFVFAFLLSQISLPPKFASIATLVFVGFSVIARNGINTGHDTWAGSWWLPGFYSLQNQGFESTSIAAYAKTLDRSRVLFFPWDLSYASQGHFQMVPLFALQSYDSYTSFLDRANAGHLKAASPPIDHVLLEWKDIDERNQVLDLPATWNELFNSFEPESSKGETVLLARRPSRLSTAFVEAEKAICPGAAWAQIPQRSTPLALSIKLTPTFTGQALFTLYKIGSVNLTVQTRSGKSLSIRIPPDVVSTPFPINYLPLTAPVLNELWKSNIVTDPISKIQLSGPGLNYFHCGEMQFYNLTGTAIRVL